MHDILYISEKRVSQITDRALSSLRNDRFLRRGLPYYKFGRAVKYRLDEVLKWAEARRIAIDQK